ncbi:MULTISPECIES: hypothetical protein [Streptomyces]|uniref:hypothetical protein n=1 Tax=Streptomyces TaxID=1883 RepID=UPI000AD29006
MYAGIDVTRTELFTGIRGAQLVGRNSLIDFGAFPTRLGKHQPFKELIALMEQALDLKNHTEEHDRADTEPGNTDPGRHPGRARKATAALQPGNGSAQAIPPAPNQPAQTNKAPGHQRRHPLPNERNGQT